MSNDRGYLYGFSSTGKLHKTLGTTLRTRRISKCGMTRRLDDLYDPSDIDYQNHDCCLKCFRHSKKSLHNIVEKAFSEWCKRVGISI